MKKGKYSFSIVIVILAITIISCSLGSFIENTSSLSVVISSPLENFSVSVGEEVEITSSSFSESGIARVALQVNGQEVASNTPQDSPSKTFVVTQNWIPIVPGTFLISVAVEDVDGQRFQYDHVTLAVVEQTNDQLPSPSETIPSSQLSTSTPQPPSSTPNPSTTTPNHTSEIIFSLSPMPIEVIPIFPTTPSSIQPIPIEVSPMFPTTSPSIQYEVAEMLIPPGQTKSLVVVCPSGSINTGGGFSQTAYNINILKSTSEGNSWHVIATNRTSNNQTVVVVAICLGNSGGTIISMNYSQYVQPDVEQDISVSCPSGSVVTGGGWTVPGDEFFIRQSSQAGNGWVVRARHNSDSPKQASVHAICLSGTNAVSDQFMEYVNIGTGKNGEATAFCQPNALVSGGGFFQEIRSYSSVPVGPNATGPTYGWHGSAYNPAHHTSFKIYVYATCLSFP